MCIAKPDKKLFVPRIGAAYRLVEQDGDTRRLGHVHRGAFMAVPVVGPPGRRPVRDRGEATAIALENGKPLFSFPMPFPADLRFADVPSQGVSGYPLRHQQRPHTQQFNVTLEHQVKDVGLRLSYIGSRSASLNYFLGDEQAGA